MRKKLTHNLGLKIISALFAIVLWLIVVNIIDPVETKTFNNVHVTVENESVITDEGKVYDIIDNSDTISVSVKGRRTALEELKSTDFLAVADMEDRIVAHIVPIDVSVTKLNNKIEDIAPKTRTLKISIEDSATKQFAINTIIDNTPTEGYAVGDITCNPSVVKVTGAASVVNRISKVAVSVDVKDMSDTISTTATPKFYDSDENVIESTSLQYDEEKIAVSVELLKTKEITPIFTIQGTPNDDYKWVDTLWSPETITIAGKEDALAEMNDLKLSNNPINIEDATDYVQQIIDISPYLSNDVRLVDSSQASVLVTAVIEKLDTVSIEIEKGDIQLLNAPTKYSVDFANNDNIIVNVKGLPEVLSAISTSDLVASVDLSSIKEAGTTTLPVTLTIADGIDAKVDEEVTVNLVVTKNTSGSDTRP
jgi:YbbR domain-containing protein